MDPFFVIHVSFVFIIMSCLFFWERADLLALLCVMIPCVLVTFQYSVSGQVWYWLYWFLSFAFFFIFSFIR